MSKRQYDNTYPSVTQILGVLRKPGLENWFKVNTPQYIKEKSSLGKKIGTEIHEAISQNILTGQTEFETQHPEEVGTALKSFILFRSEHPEIELKLSEVALTSEVYKFNGTIDCPCPPILVDWKSSEAKDKDKPAIYDEYRYQVSAYFYLWNELMSPKMQETYIVAIAKDKVAYNLCRMLKAEIDACFQEVFLPTLKIYNYQHAK